MEQEDESRNVVNKKALTILKHSHRGGTIKCTNGSAHFFIETFRRSFTHFAFNYDKAKLTLDSIKTAGSSMPSTPPTCSDTGVNCSDPLTDAVAGFIFLCHQASIYFIY